MACVACCAGPILGLLTAAGLATVGGFVMFGAIALVVGAVTAALILAARARKRPAVEIPVEITEHPAHLGGLAAPPPSAPPSNASSAPVPDPARPGEPFPPSPVAATR